MIVEIRKVISAPSIKKGIEEVCKETGMTYTEYAYSLIVQDLARRNASKNLSSDIANERFDAKTFLAEVTRVVEKYDRLIPAK